MVPLISIFWQRDDPEVSNWQKQIEKILELLEAMRDWSLAARRTREVVGRMYDASQQLKPHGAPQTMTDGSALRIPSLAVEPGGNDAGIMDMFDPSGPWDFDEMLWGAAEGMDYAPLGNFDDNMAAVYGTSLWTTEAEQALSETTDRMGTRGQP
jgi:hypothetical protein